MKTNSGRKDDSDGRAVSSCAGEIYTSVDVLRTNSSYVKNGLRNLLAVSSILLLAIRATCADRSCFRHSVAFNGLASPASSALSRCLKNFSSCSPHRVCAINAFHCRSVGHHDSSSRCGPLPTVDKYVCRKRIKKASYLCNSRYDRRSPRLPTH